MRHFTRLALVLLGSTLLAAGSGCGRGPRQATEVSREDATREDAPPYAGEWVLDGFIDGKGAFRPAPPPELSALRFDPPAAVSAAPYDAETGAVDRASIQTGFYVVAEADPEAVQFGAMAAKVEDGHLMVIYPGDGALRMSRPKRGPLFPKVGEREMSRLVAEIERARQNQDAP